MPRVAADVEVARATRASLRSNVSASSGSSANTTNKAQRRALGDVSNRRSTRSATNVSKSAVAPQEGQSQPPLRRSLRLSVAPEQRNPVEDNGSKRRKSLRASTKVQALQNHEIAPKDHAPKPSKPNSEAEKPPTKHGTTRRSSSRGVSSSRQVESKSRSKLSKRNREAQAGTSDRPRKVARVNQSLVCRAASATSDSYMAGEQSTLTSIHRNICTDFLPHTDYGLVREPFDSSKFTAGISVHDSEEREDVLEVSNYVTDIYQRLYHAETYAHPAPYMDRQPSLNGMMRAILVDWLVEVHMKFHLMPETLYLSVNIIDRYLSKVQVERKKLQLVGVTALLVACKYEEIYPPEVKDCVYITDRAYTRQDVLDMEAHIVKKLQFRMTVPTGYPFLQRFLHITKATKAMKSLANYYMERMLQEYSTLRYRPSLVAAAAVTLAMNNPDVLGYEGFNSNKPPGLPEPLTAYTGFVEEDIMEVATLMAYKISEETTTYSRRELVSVKRKYGADRYSNASTAFIDPDVNHILPR